MSAEAVVLTNAMLVYLDTRAERGASLGDLAEHFGVSWRRVLDLLWSASLVEIDGLVDAYSLVLPPRPGREEPGEDAATKDSFVWLGPTSSARIPELALTLDEVIAIVAVIDSIWELTPPGDSSDALSTLRGKLVDACEAAGFSGIIWRAPTPVIGAEAMSNLNVALAARSWVEFTYHRPGEDLRESVSRIRAIPLEVRSAVNPLLLAWNEDGARSYRLDRIGALRVLRDSSREERAAAARLAKEPEWQPEGEEVTLTVAAAGRWIAETLPGAVAVRHGERTDVTFRSESDEFLASLLTQLGPAVLSVRPAGVAGRMSRRFARLAEATR